MCVLIDLVDQAWIHWRNQNYRLSPHEREEYSDSNMRAYLVHVSYMQYNLVFHFLLASPSRLLTNGNKVLSNNDQFSLRISRIPSILTIISFHTFGIRFNGPEVPSDKESKRGPITHVAIHLIQFITSS